MKNKKKNQQNKTKFKENNPSPNNTYPTVL